MNEHGTPEQAAAVAQAKQWNTAATACSVATAALIVAGIPLSEYLSRRFGVGDEALLVAFILLSVIWIGMTIYCSSRANEQRCVAVGQRHWRQQRKERAEELARAEAYLAMKKR